MASHTPVYVRFLVGFGSVGLERLRASFYPLPAYPVEGCSLERPIVDPAGAPASPVMDDMPSVVAAFAVTGRGERM